MVVCIFLYVQFLFEDGGSRFIRNLSTELTDHTTSVLSQYGSRRCLQNVGIARSKRDGTRAETKFGLSAKRTSPFKSAGVSVQSTTGSR